MYSKKTQMNQFNRLFRCFLFCTFRIVNDSSTPFPNDTKEVHLSGLLIQNIHLTEEKHADSNELSARCKISPSWINSIFFAKEQPLLNGATIITT